MSQPVIEVKGVTVNRNGAEAIKDASLTVERGDFVGIVGPNGGGKTTLINAILGVLPRASGTIRLLGKPLEAFNEWNKIAYVSQTSINFDASFPLTVRELVALGRITRGNLGRPLTRVDYEKVKEGLQLMAISDLADKRIGNLSGGQKQRVFVAKAIVRDPEILFLDEPVAGVDPETQERFYMSLSNLNEKKGVTILDVSHDLSAVFCRMKRVICVNKVVSSAPITDEAAFTDALRAVYGEHFHFVFHEHTCQGMFQDV
jgi:zinc transport system ATP-binding protein